MSANNNVSIRSFFGLNPVSAINLCDEEKVTKAMIIKMIEDAGETPPPMRWKKDNMICTLIEVADAMHEEEERVKKAEAEKKAKFDITRILPMDQLIAWTNKYKRANNPEHQYQLSLKVFGKRTKAEMEEMLKELSTMDGAIPKVIFEMAKIYYERKTGQTQAKRAKKADKKIARKPAPRQEQPVVQYDDDDSVIPVEEIEEKLANLKEKAARRNNTTVANTTSQENVMIRTNIINSIHFANTNSAPVISVNGQAIIESVFAALVKSGAIEEIKAKVEEAVDEAEALLPAIAIAIENDMSSANTAANNAAQETIMSANTTTVRVAHIRNDAITMLNNKGYKAAKTFVGNAKTKKDITAEQAKTILAELKTRRDEMRAVANEKAEAQAEAAKKSDAEKKEEEKRMKKAEEKKAKKAEAKAKRDEKNEEIRLITKRVLDRWYAERVPGLKAKWMPRHIGTFMVSENVIKAEAGFLSLVQIANTLYLKKDKEQKKADRKAYNRDTVKLALEASTISEILREQDKEMKIRVAQRHASDLVTVYSFLTEEQKNQVLVAYCFGIKAVAPSIRNSIFRATIGAAASTIVNVKKAKTAIKENTMFKHITAIIAYCSLTSIRERRLNGLKAKLCKMENKLDSQTIRNEAEEVKLNKKIKKTMAKIEKAEEKKEETLSADIFTVTRIVTAKIRGGLRRLGAAIKGLFSSSEEVVDATVAVIATANA